jgi:hypothetical protein
MRVQQIVFHCGNEAESSLISAISERKRELLKIKLWAILCSVLLDPHANSSGHRVIAAQLLKGFERIGLLAGFSGRG